METHTGAPSRPFRRILLRAAAPLAILALVGAAWFAVVRPTMAQTATASAWPSEVTLPAGRKLVSVAWLCYQACEPWVVTRPMRAGETVESYSFTNGRETIVYRETAPAR